MSKIQFIYFEGCPNAKKILAMLDELELGFEKIEQNSLQDRDKLKNYSSPTIISGDKIVFGTKADGGGCSLNLPTLATLKSKLSLGN